MRSIRLSLMLYFLGLLCAALTVASLLLYNTAQNTLRAKEQATEALIVARYEERSREARQRLDERLLAQSKSLAGRVRPRYRWDRINNLEIRLVALGVLSTTLGPSAPFSSLVSYLQGPAYDHRGSLFHSRTSVNKGRWPVPTPFQYHLWKHKFIDIDLGRDVEGIDDQGWPRIAYRIDTNYYSTPHIPANQTVVLPDGGGFASRSRLTWTVDDYRSPEGEAFRRVLFRSRITLQDTLGPQGPGPWRGSYRTEPPSIIIQCAANLSELDAVFRELRENRDAEIELLRTETEFALSQHRRQLYWICGFTFIATAFGSLVLVWLGLKPLSRLGDAVSSVSPTNFRLAIDHTRLPNELRPIAERLGTTLELLQRAFAREKQATADISHELRTPLAAMLTTIDLALRKPRSPEQYQEFFADCRFSVTQMHQIVERLLTLARLDAGVDRLRAQAVDVMELAQQCACVVRPLAEARGLCLHVADDRRNTEPGQDNDPIHTDPDKLREVLTNLLHNAIQYNRPHGRIELMIGRANGQVMLAVSDTGIGIAPEIREQIFERFYRADPSRNSDDLHAGLGLAIVKEYVDLMGGRISVESQEGQGSTFRVVLPVHESAQAG